MMKFLQPTRSEPRTARTLLRPLAIGAFRVVDRLRPASHRYILILSHMRSGSTLLLHLLMTSPEISGCGERNTVYRNCNDLAMLALKSNLARPRKHWATYSVDQINHTRFVQSIELLAHPSVYPIILLREPQAAIGSMVDVLGQYYDFGVNDALEHYRERVSTLTHYAEFLRVHGRMMSLTYDELLDNTRNSVLRLKDYLELDVELSEKYSAFDFTGKRGDPSSRILAGRVLTERTQRPDVVKPADLAELTAHFHSCLSASRNSCS